MNMLFLLADLILEGDQVHLELGHLLAREVVKVEEVCYGDLGVLVARRGGLGQHALLLVEDAS